MRSLISLPACYPIVDCDIAPDPEFFAQQLLTAQASLLQLRWKSATVEEFSRLASAVVSLRDRIAPAARIIVNDWVEVCLTSGADGLHLGQEDIAPETARRTLGDQAIIGLSTHTMEQVQLALAQPVDYLGYGPIFQSTTKIGHAATTGLASLRLATALSERPIVAIGGISINDAPQLFANSATACAVISDLLTVRCHLKEYLQEWEVRRASSANAHAI